MAEHSVARLASFDPDAESHLRDRLRAGDDRAFEELVISLTPKLLATARRFLQDESDACDALQDAFLSAFRAMHSFAGESKLSTWLHRITVNACLMKLRARQRRSERSIDDLLPAFRADGHSATPEREWHMPSEVLSPEMRRRLVDAVDELPDAYRTVLMLRDVEGLDTAETAAALGVSENAIKMRLHRARQALKTLLDPYMTELTQ